MAEPGPDVSRDAPIPGVPSLVTQLPEHLIGFEEKTSNGYMYPATAMGRDLMPVHSHYLGSDHWTPYLVDKDLDARESAQQWPAIFVVTLCDGSKRSFGNGRSSRFTMGFLTDVQVPGLVLTIRVSPDGCSEEDRQIARCYIFGNSVRTLIAEQSSHQNPRNSNNDRCMRFDMIHTGGNGAQRSNIKRGLPPSVKADKRFFNKIGSASLPVCRTDVGFWLLDEFQYGDIPSVQRTIPIWLGVEGQLLRRWAMNVRDQNDAGMSEAEKAVGALYDVPLYLEACVFMNEEWTPQSITMLCGFMMGAMAAASSWGPAWQYEKQALSVGTSIRDPECVFQMDFAVPRHMVSEWSVQNDASGRPIVSLIRPTKWGGITVLPVYPTPSAAAFLGAFGYLRETEARKKIVKEAMLHIDDVTAKFRPISETDNDYRVSIEVPNLKREIAKLLPEQCKNRRLSEILPEQGESFKFILKSDTKNVDKNAWYLVGVTDSTIDEQDNTVIEGTVHAEPSQMARMTASSEFKPATDYKYPIHLDLWVSSELCRRIVKALYEFAGLSPT